MKLSAKKKVVKWSFKSKFGLLVLLPMLLWMVSGSIHAEETALHYYDKLLDVHMLDTGDAWAVGHVGKLIYSDNFGKDWVSLDAKTVKGLFSVFFVTPEKGWITGEAGLILYTEDGGKTWTTQGEGVTDQPLLKSFFLNESKGWAVGSFGTVLTTNDGGANWRKTAFSKDMSFNDIYFFDENKGYAAGEFENVMLTEDGGETWKPLIEQGWGDLGNYFGIAFTDENSAVIVGTSGNIKYTTDAGQTWQAAENNEANKSTLLKVRFFNEKQGVAIGLDGAMVFTKDGGLSWDPPTPITQFTWFSGISLLEDGHGVVVGIGNILITDDFGKTWDSPFGDMTR